MPRLFTGLEVPPTVRSQLVALQTGLRGARWVEPSDLHLTLRFIGDVNDAQADLIVEALDSRARKKAYAKPVLQPAGLSAFGGVAPRSVHLRLRDDETLSVLQRSHEMVMQRAGLKAEKRKFTPHVTLARFSGEVGPDAVAHWLAQNGAVRLPDWEPSRFVLYCARESTGGGPYIAEEVWALG